MAPSPKKPKEDPATKALRAQQLVDLSNLNDEENLRMKKLLYTGRFGARAYRGSPLFRAPPGNTAMTPAGRGSAAPGAAAMRAGGIASGAARAFNRFGAVHQ